MWWHRFFKSSTKCLGLLLSAIDQLTFRDERLDEALELFYWFVVRVEEAITRFNNFHSEIESRFGESNLADPRARHFFQVGMEERRGFLDFINMNDTTQIERWIVDNIPDLLPQFSYLIVDGELNVN
jgi:hypothetical protein